MKTVYIIEHDLNIALTIINSFKSLDIQVLHFISPLKALDEFNRKTPDMIIIDIMVEERLCSLDVARIIRSKSQIPILFTTHNNDLFDYSSLQKIDYYDHICKPFCLIELRLRVFKLLDKITATSGIKLGRFSYNPDEQKIILGSNEYHIGTYDNMILRILCDHIGIYVDKEYISKRVFGDDDLKIRNPAILNSISRIRKILKLDPNVIIESNNKLKIRIRVKKRRRRKKITSRDIAKIIM